MFSGGSCPHEPQPAGHRRVYHGAAQECAFLTAGELGRRVGVSESTVVRFATAVGFPGYPELQRALQEELRQRLSTVERMEAGPRRHPAAGRHAAGRLAKRRGQRQPHVPNAAEGRLRPGRGHAGRSPAYLRHRAAHVGVRGVLLATALRYLGKSAFRIDLGVGDFWERLDVAGPEDVIFGISVPRYTRWTAEMLDYARRKHIPTVVLTDNPVSPLSELADVTLPAVTDFYAFIESFYTPLSLVNVPILGVALHDEQRTLQVLRLREDLWREKQLYDRPEYVHWGDAGEGDTVGTSLAACDWRSVAEQEVETVQKSSLRSLSVVLAALLVVATLALTVGARTWFLNLSTGGPGGVYFPLGGAMADVLSRNMPGVIVTAESTARRWRTLAWSETVFPTWAWCSAASRTRRITARCRLRRAHGHRGALPALSGAAALGRPERFGHHFDQRLAGTAGVHGSPGQRSGNHRSGDPRNVRHRPGPRHDPGASVSERIRGRLGGPDRGRDFLNFAYPGAAVEQIAQVRDIDLVSLEPDMLDRILEAHPYFVRSVIPAGTYRGVDRDVLALGDSNVIIAHRSMPDDLAYQIVKTIYENAAALHPVHPVALQLVPENGIHSPIPLHPGAERYFREVGVLD